MLDGSRHYHGTTALPVTLLILLILLILILLLSRVTLIY